MSRLRFACSLLLLAPVLACASATSEPSTAAGSQCTIETDARGHQHVVSVADGFAFELPAGFQIDCEPDRDLADTWLLAASLDQPSVGVIDAAVIRLPSAAPEAALDTLVDIFATKDALSFGLELTTEPVDASSEDQTWRCYEGSTRGPFAGGHYYACARVEVQPRGRAIGSVIRVLAARDEWAINAEASARLVESLSRAWTLAPSIQPEPESEPEPEQAASSGTDCAARLGLRPEALAAACGFGELLAQVELHGFCELHYAGSTGEPGVVVNLRELRHRSADAAWGIHRATMLDTPGETYGQLPGVLGSHWSALGGYRWVYLPGWTHARRIGWFEADCAPTQIAAILDQMLATAEPLAEPAPTIAPAPRAQLLDDSLATRYGERTDLDLDYLGGRALPDKAKTLIVTLLSAAARDDVILAEAVLGPDAGYGLPDRRELDAWPISGANFEPFMIGLRNVAARLPPDAQFSCPPIAHEFIGAVARGEQPMWCFYTSEDALDLLVFRLLVVDGVGGIDYVGMYETKPEAETEPPIPARSLAQGTEPLPPIVVSDSPELPAPVRDP